MSRSSSAPNQKGLDSRLAEVVLALQDAINEGDDLVLIDSSIVPSSVMSASDIYRLTHEWESNRNAIANVSNDCKRLVKRLERAKPDSRGDVVDGV